MRPECLDLQASFGAEYRVISDKRADPWLASIPCRHGEIFPHGGKLLAAGTYRRGAKARRLASLAGCRVYQDGDDGLTTLFDVADFDAVAAVMEPKRRVRWSPERRARVALCPLPN